MPSASEDGDYFNHILSVCSGVERKNYKAYKNSVALQQIIDLSVNASHDY